MSEIEFEAFKWLCGTIMAISFLIFIYHMVRKGKERKENNYEQG